MSAAPGELEVVRSFLNSTDIGSGSDQLGSPAELVAWLSEHSLLEDGAKAGEQDLERSRTLRSALRALCSANASGELDREVPPVLDAAAERAGLRLRFGADGDAKVAPSAEGVDGAHGRLLAIVAETMRAGTWERLKVCRSEECGWAFYDASKNHSRAWCSMAVCGNRAKARSFRERHAGA
ncbi:MAG: CGNR zinc finger domain-containing protein [Gaiellaceae bacterium]|jgi:predicted RNA-binding Zn ribbon-like protein